MTNVLTNTCHQPTKNTLCLQIMTFKKQQVLAFQDALCLFGEAKVKTARDTYALLAKSLLLFKQMEV